MLMPHTGSNTKAPLGFGQWHPRDIREIFHGAGIFELRSRGLVKCYLLRSGQYIVLGLNMGFELA